MDILCAHIRSTTGKDEYREQHRSAPSEEIQSLLDLLVMREHAVFKGLRVDLRESWLQGATLSDARLQGAILWEAQLQEANFGGAQLQGASLFGAQLQGANFWNAQLQGADLWGAQLQGVTTRPPAESGNPTHSDFAERIEASIGIETDLSGATFQGGLVRRDLDFRPEGLSDKLAKTLREQLELHLGKPASHQLPENSGAITGAYTKEEAERWIAAHEKAISKTSGENGS